MKIYIVIPFYNESLHVGNVVSGLLKYPFPIIAVDDGSTDSGSQVIVAKNTSAKNMGAKNVKIIRHKINLGKGAAMKTGAEHAFSLGADAVIFMDADGQHNPKDLVHFVEALDKDNSEIVFGSRNFSYGVPLIRFLGNKIASATISILFGIYISDVICGFRAITKKAFKKTEWTSTGYGVETEMVIRAGKSGLKYKEVPVETLYHNNVKGVTILDALGIFVEVVKWRLTL